MTAEQIKSLRGKLGETTAVFAERFCRSGRTIEDWEQGRRNPDPLALALLRSLFAETFPRRKRKSAV